MVIINNRSDCRLMARIAANVNHIQCAYIIVALNDYSVSLSSAILTHTVCYSITMCSNVHMITAICKV